jgi:hypothetical protein
MRHRFPPTGFVAEFAKYPVLSTKYSVATVAAQARNFPGGGSVFMTRLEVCLRVFLPVLLILSAAMAPAQDAKIQNAKLEEVGKSPVETRLAPGGRVRMELCSSGIELMGRDDSVVRVSYDRHANVKVRLHVSGDQADLKVSRCPRNNFHVTIEVPKSSDLYVRMLAGELEVRDVTGDKDVELHFGQLTMDVGKPDDYAHVDASVNSGDLEATAFDVSKGGLFRSFETSGPGKYRLHAHVGAGELDLR